ncbi:AAA family ATPase [Roseibium sp. FZY0029]|uniref:AAA family ATPase n=1 Tax=Roseibium sp. FZY0029 TaxID=3116647 RepID=UPI002EB3F992|nr:AAA family ATPase [Roseibium sp. FZY0029]
MTKLRKLSVSGFRGARFALPLDFTNKSRSLAIFGENAAGKSTITDALEWFLTDRVGHLWREDCKQEALRHVLIAEGDDSTVAVEFIGDSLTGVKRLSSALRTSTDLANDNTRAVVEGLQDDRIILRHADIVAFLDQQKGAKRKAIADIIGYEEINKFRDAIQGTLNALKREPAYTGAKSHSVTLEGDMVRDVGQIVPDRQAFLTIAQNIVAPFALGIEITDEATFAEVVKALNGLGNSEEKIKKAQRLDQLAKTCTALVAEITTFAPHAEAFVTSYNALAKERESVNQLRLSDFLNKGHAVIESEDYVDDACPFCLSAYELGLLQGEVARRIESMSAIQERLDNVKDQKDAVLQAILSIGIQAKAIGETYTDLTGFDDLMAATATARKVLRAAHLGITAAFEGLTVFEAPDGFEHDVARLQHCCETGAAKAEEEAGKLGLSEQEQQIATALSSLRTLEGQVRDYERAQRVIDAHEAQILTLDAIFERFVTVQNAALQSVLDTISADVGKFYAKLHPDESVDNVRLTMVGEEGVEFQYAFHGQEVQPPRKYLSESHLNSLGVVLFLANARIFNKQARFLVLDDIVTSFDTSHRRRLLRLLRDEFSDWQMIILTHESVWFEIIKKEMAQHGWKFHEVRTDGPNGIVLDDSPASLKEIIAQKKGKDDVTNDLRKLLEMVLKEICASLEVKVAFRFNEWNEKRMADELISQLRSTLGNKSPDLKNNDVFSDLAGSALVANLVSHDNTDKIVGKDIDVLLEDIEKLVSLFSCPECDRYISARIEVPGAKAISCKCGKTQIPWK